MTTNATSASEKEELILFLAGLSDDDDIAQLLRRSTKAPLQDLHGILSGIERTPGISPELWNAIVVFKAYLGGRRTREDVKRAGYRVQGLM